MRAISYLRVGGPEVLRLGQRPISQPGPGEVRVRVFVSGVNPTDWKSRSGSGRGHEEFQEVIPHHDGAGLIDAVGAGVDPERVGERVWVWEAARHSRGTAQEHTVLPERQAVALPDTASLDEGAVLGIPAMTAYRCLTVSQAGPDRLFPLSLAGRTVLVAGGAGAVGHAAIQLAHWAGARVIATVSNSFKERLALAAGASHTVNYRDPRASVEIRRLTPGGVDIVVEVAPAINTDLNSSVLSPDGTVAVYGREGGNELCLPTQELIPRNISYRFVLVFTVPGPAKDDAVNDITDALADGALPVGEAAGLPLHRFGLERTSAAHAAGEEGRVGKILIDLP